MNNVWTVKPSSIIRDHAITVENHGHWSDHTVITGVITPITPCEGVITVKGVITPVITGVICDHAVITKYFYWGLWEGYNAKFLIQSKKGQIPRVLLFTNLNQYKCYSQ